MEKERFTDKQIDFIKSHEADINDPVDIFDKMSDLLGSSGFDEDYNITEIGIICEDILDILADIDEG